MVLHIGKKIKDVLYNKRIRVSDFAKSINRSRNVVYDIFERQAIDTDLLKKISEVLEFNFFDYYMKNMVSGEAEENQHSYNSGNSLKEELKQCRKELDDLKEKYELLVKINKLLEDKDLKSIDKRKKK